MFAAREVHCDSRGCGGGGARLRLLDYRQALCDISKLCSERTRVGDKSRLHSLKCGEEGVGSGVSGRRARGTGMRSGAIDRAVRRRGGATR